MLRKGVYPYEYMRTLDSFNKTQLPLEDLFYSSLYMDIIDYDYKHVQNVRKTLYMVIYHDLYLSDVLLLADVFDNFRDKCTDIYELDPAYFFTAPSWCAALKFTGIILESHHRLK